VSGFFSRSYTESQSFKKHIKSKPLQVIFSEQKLKTVTDTLDENESQNILILYIHAVHNPNNINPYIMKKILNNIDLSMFINSNFQFYPILSTAKELSLFKNFFGARDVPCFLFFRWGIENKLKLLRMVNLRNKLSSDQVMEAMSDVLELAEEQVKSEKKLVMDIHEKKKRRNELELEHVRKVNELYNQQDRMSKQNV
jgi:hypothetical protein